MFDLYFTVDTSLRSAISRMVAVGYQQLHMSILSIIMPLCQDCSREPPTNFAYLQKIFRVALNH